MPSLLLGWPNKREGEQKILHTFSDNTEKQDIMSKVVFSRPKMR